MSTKFHDRKEAGLLLAERLKVYNRNTFGSEEEDKKRIFYCYGHSSWRCYFR